MESKQDSERIESHILLTDSLASLSVRVGIHPVTAQQTTYEPPGKVALLFIHHT